MQPCEDFPEDQQPERGLHSTGNQLSWVMAKFPYLHFGYAQRLIEEGNNRIDRIFHLIHDRFSRASSPFALS
jgi:hypothetical protein